MTLLRIFCLVLFYGFLRYLPASTCKIPYVGKISRFLRYHCCKYIFEYCGKNVNIEKMATFGTGKKIRIGDNSGIGVHCNVPNDTIIGQNVMMGPYCFFLGENHAFERTDIAMILQGFTPHERTIIEDDIWIGRCCTFTPGRTIKKGCIIAACSVVTKDFPEYSIIGGNPAKLIRNRK